MHWYSKLIKQANKPPAYIIERISDLEHAMELLTSSPREAKNIILHVANKLDEHQDTEFSLPLKAAAKTIIDNPSETKAIIGRIISMMLISKEIHEDNERQKSWMDLFKKKN